MSQLGFVMTPSSCASRLPHWNMLGSSSLSSVISTARGLSLDIRPANVMVSLDGTRVYLTDFGFATKVGEMKTYEGALSTAFNRILVLKHDSPDDNIGVTVADELESVVKVPFI